MADHLARGIGDLRVLTLVTEHELRLRACLSDGFR
jgi:hypothetical protein